MPMAPQSFHTRVANFLCVHLRRLYTGAPTSQGLREDRMLRIARWCFGSDTRALQRVGVAMVALVAALAAGSPARGGNIFDDDWTPPPPRKAPPTMQDFATTRPETVVAEPTSKV